MIPGNAAASNLRYADSDIFDVQIEVVDEESMQGSIGCRRMAIDGSVRLVAFSYDDEVVPLALTAEQARMLGLYLLGGSDA